MSVVIEYIKTILCIYIIVNYFGRLCVLEKYSKQITLICVATIVVFILGMIVYHGIDESLLEDIGLQYTGNFEPDRKLNAIVMDIEREQENIYISYYEEEVKKKINSFLGDWDCSVESVSVYINLDSESVNYGELEKMDIGLSVSEKTVIDNEGIENYRITELKNKVANFYNLSVWNININMEEQIEQ